MADSLARKMALVAKECGYVQKTGRNDFHRYKYATAADVLAKVNEALAEHGVCATVDPSVLSESVDNGNRTVTVKVALTLHDGDSDQTFTTAGIGCGQDKGDKAVMKAQTAAIKYAWMLALNISTGDDPEADEDTDKRAHVAPAPRQQVPPKQVPPSPSNGSPTPAASHPAARPDRDPALLDLWASAEASQDALRSVGAEPAPLPPNEATHDTLTAYVFAARKAYRAQKAQKVTA
jgi:hypothetical protein